MEHLLDTVLADEALSDAQKGRIALALGRVDKVRALARYPVFLALFFSRVSCFLCR